MPVGIFVFGPEKFLVRHQLNHISRKKMYASNPYYVPPVSSRLSQPAVYPAASVYSPYTPPQEELVGQAPPTITPTTFVQQSGSASYRSSFVDLGGYNTSNTRMSEASKYQLQNVTLYSLSH